MASRRAVGSLIGIGFLLMILAVGVSYYDVRSRVENRSNEILQNMMEQDMGAADENLEIQNVALTAGNSLNLTIKNTGSILSQLDWIGFFDDTLNKKTYYKVDTSLNPIETQTAIGNTSITMNPVNTYTIQVLTKLGNSYYGEYPMPVTPGGSGSNTTSQYYFVEFTGDNHLPVEIGTQSLFSAMKAGPDYINNTISEELFITPSQSTTLINAESFEGNWPPTGWTATGVWNKETDVVYDGSYSADFDGSGGGGQSGNLYSPAMDCSDADTIIVDFYFYDNNLDNNELRFYFWDGSNWDEMLDLSTYGTEETWQHIQITSTDSQYLIGNFQIRYEANSVDNNEHAYVDLVTVIKEITGGSYYYLDIEVSWINLLSKINEYLTMRARAVNLLTDIEPGYNVVDVSGVLSGSAFSIRFTDSLGLGMVFRIAGLSTQCT